MNYILISVEMDCL